MPLEAKRHRIGWRVTLYESPEGLFIHILTPKRLLFLAVLFVGLCVWFSFIGFIAYNQFKTGELAFPILASGLGLIFTYVWLWGVAGKEIISLTNRQISIQQSVFGLGSKQVYDLSQIRNVRRSRTNPPMLASEERREFLGLAGGRVAFEYRGSVHRFGLLLTDEEADALAASVVQFINSSSDSLSSSVKNL